MSTGVPEAVQAALDNEQYDAVARILDQAELDSSNPDVLARGWPHALHLLGHIYNQQLEDARFLWKRIPADVKRDDPQLDAVWRLLQYFWAQHYEGIWQALQGYQWQPQVRPLITALIESWRTRMLGLASEAYSLIAPAALASLLGVSEVEAGQIAEDAGWKQDMESGMWVTTPRRDPDTPLDGQLQLQQLSSYVVHLESS